MPKLPILDNSEDTNMCTEQLELFEHPSMSGAESKLAALRARETSRDTILEDSGVSFSFHEIFDDGSVIIYTATLQEEL